MGLENIAEITDSIDKLLSVAGGRDWIALGGQFDRWVIEYAKTWSPNHEVIFQDTKLGFQVKQGPRDANVKNKVKGILNDVVGVPFERKFDMFVDVYAKEEVLLPYDITKLSAEDRAEVETRARNETVIGHITNFPQTLFVFRSSVGWEKSRNNPFLKRMRTYSDYFGDSEPFFERGGQISNLSLDAMASTRFHVLLMSALFYEFWSTEEVLPVDVLTEVSEFIFESPYANGLKFKGMKSILKQSVCALAPMNEGLFPRWDAADFKSPKAQVTGFQESTVHHNDEVYYQYVSSELLKNVEELNVAGLSKFAALYMKLVRAAPSPKTMATYSAVIALDAMGGYTRSLSSISHVEQTKRDFEVEVPEMYNDLLFEWTTFMEWARTNKRFLNYNETKRKFAEVLTSKSAGGKNLILKIELDSLTFKGKNEFSKIAKDNSKDNVILQRYTDKLMLFFSNPDYFIDPNTVKLGYTHENPGFTGSRDVVGFKMTRAIFMERLETYLAEVPFALPLADYQSQRNDDSTYFGSSSDFTVGKETGCIFIDHAAGIIASSVGYILIEGADFKSFDTYQTWLSTRKPALEAIVKVLTLMGGDQPWGPWEGGLVEVIQTIWSQAQKGNAVYITKDPITGEPVEMILNQLQSGEFMTLNFNNMTNRAYWRNLKRNLDERAPKVTGSMTFQRTQFQGDDSMRFWKLFNPATYDVETYKEFIDVVVSTARANGLSINGFKTVVRLCYYEYLKKHAVYGYYVPLLHMQPYGAERLNDYEFPVSQCIAYGSFLSSYVARGGRHDIMVRSLAYTWALRRAIKMKVRGPTGKVDRTDLYYLPFMLLYTPIEMGGCGAVPYSLLGASRDIIIAIDCINDDLLREMVNYASSVVDIVDKDVKQKIADQTIEGIKVTRENEDGTFSPYPLQAGIDFVRGTLIEERVRIAIDAKANLMMSSDVPRMPHGLFYPDMPESKVREAVKYAKQQRHAAALSKLENGAAYREKADALKVKKQPTKDITRFFPWVFTCGFTFLEELDNWKGHSITPVAGVDPKLEQISLKFGTSMMGNENSLNPNSVMDMIRKDKMFRRDLRAETIFEYITHSSILPHASRIIDALKAMGLAADIASQIANTLRSNETAFNFRQNARSFSLSDQFMPNLDLSIQGHKRVVECTTFTDNTLVHNLVMEVGMLYAVLHATISPPRRVKITFSDTTYAIMQKSIFGKKLDPTFNLHRDQFPIEIEE